MGAPAPGRCVNPRRTVIGLGVAAATRGKNAECAAAFLYGTVMMESPLDRYLLIRSRVAEGYHFGEDALKHTQHVMTDWFPRAVFGDLTGDTIKIEVLIKKGFTSGKSVYSASFLRADDSLIKCTDYDEDRLIGRTCRSYNQKKSGYYGTKNGFDYRLVLYTSEPPTITFRR